MGVWSNSPSKVVQLSGAVERYELLRDKIMVESE